MGSHAFILASPRQPQMGHYGHSGTRELIRGKNMSSATARYPQAKCNSVYPPEKIDFSRRAFSLWTLICGINLLKFVRFRFLSYTRSANLWSCWTFLASSLSALFHHSALFRCDLQSRVLSYVRRPHRDTYNAIRPSGFWCSYSLLYDRGTYTTAFSKTGRGHVRVCIWNASYIYKPTFKRRRTLWFCEFLVIFPSFCCIVSIHSIHYRN